MSLPNVLLHRRQWLVWMCAATTGAGVCAAPVAAPATPDARQFAALLARFAEEILRLAPTSATGLGVDTGPRRALRWQLPDAGAEGDVRWARQVRAMRARLQALDARALDGADRLRHDSVQHAVAMGLQGLDFEWGGAASGFWGGTSPFPVTQQDGAIVGLPEFLHTQHPIHDADDARAYLARLDALARTLDQETRRIVQQAGRGVMPPDFILRTALAQLTAFRRTPAEQQKLVLSLAMRTRARGIAGPWGARAQALVRQKLYPALERQIAVLQRAAAQATDVAGVHRLPDGDAYYDWALRLGTTTRHTAAEVHAIGLEQTRAIESRMDALLRARGLSEGTVGERMGALTRQPGMFYPDDDAGRDAIIAYCNDRVEAIRALMPRLSRLGLKAPLRIQRVPPDIEQGAGLGYMNFAALDGSRPAIYYINLKSTTLWARYELATLTAHEGLPGHAWQGAYLAEQGGRMPLLASLMGFNAFTEGWALYAEQLCDEAGLYENDPLGQLGYLQAQQFRACRLVVDTGLHALRWTRPQAIEYLTRATGRTGDAMVSEVDRYCVAPGQACGYKMGHNEILRLREQARTALGARFDEAGFNDAVVRTGGVPMPVLGDAIAQWMRAQPTGPAGT